MDDESPPAKAEAQVRRPLRIPRKLREVNAISKSMTPLTKSQNWGELLQLSVKMPLPALQQPSQAEDPNGWSGATFVLSMEGFFPHLSQGSPEVFFYAGKNRHRW